MCCGIRLGAWGGDGAAGRIVPVPPLQRVREPGAAAGRRRGEHWVDEVLRRRFLRLGMASIVFDVYNGWQYYISHVFPIGVVLSFSLLFNSAATERH
jgi:hypothetical protein